MTIYFSECRSTICRKATAKRHHVEPAYKMLRITFSQDNKTVLNVAVDSAGISRIADIY